MSRILNLGGGSGGGVTLPVDAVAFSAAMAAVTNFGDDSAEESLANHMDLNTPDVNVGEFTIDTSGGVDRVVIPEDGNYQVVFSTVADADNFNLTNTRFTLTSQLVRSSSGTETNIGVPSYGFARGRFYESVTFTSAQCETIVELEEGDLIWGAIAGEYQGGTTNATVNGEIQILKMAGARGAVGATGSTGAPGVDGDDGDDGAVGAKGDAGDTGPAGPTGPTGPTGAAGTDGATTLGALSDVEDNFGTTGQVLAVNSGADGAEWVNQTGGGGVTNLSSTGGAETLTIESSTGTDVTLVGADAAGDAGLMTRTDKGFLNLTILDPNAWSGNLAGFGHAAANVANAFDTFVPSNILEYEFGGAYDAHILVRYQDVLYRSRVAIAFSSEIPPLDPDEWSEISTHRLESYGEVADEQVGVLGFFMRALDAQAADDGEQESNAALDATRSDNIPQGIVKRTNARNGFQARVDGVSVFFDDDGSWNVPLNVSDVNAINANTAAGTLSFQARINDTGDWNTVYSGTLNLAAAAVGTFDIGMAAQGTDTERTYNLDLDETLDFIWVWDVTSGNVSATTVYPTNAVIATPLECKISGIRESRHIFAHGTGTFDGQLTATPSEGTEVALIDMEADDGPTYVGPIQQSRVQEQQAQADFDDSDTTSPSYIANKNVLALGDTPGAFGNAGQILQVNTATSALEWTDKGSVTPVADVAYSARGANQSSWHSDDFAEYSGTLTASVNDGSFTLSTDTDQKVIVPEDGVYEVTAVMYLNANNDSSGGTDLRPQLRIRRDRSGTVVSLGHEATGHIRGNAGNIGSRGTVIAVGVADLEEDDEIFTEARAWRQDTGTDATVSLDISLVKVGGAKGATGAAGADGLKGDTGDTGPKGDTGADGMHGAAANKGDTGDTGPKGDTGDTGAPGAAGTHGTDGADGATGVTGAKGDKGDPGDTGAAGADGTTNLAIANRDADSLEVASSTGTDVEVPAATTSLAGLESAADKTKLDGIATGAEVNVTELPVVSATDNDEVLTVVSGAWAAAAIIDPTDFERNLSTTDATVQDVADAFDSYVPDSMQVFRSGVSYRENDIVRYQNIFYRSNVAITLSTHIPPLDTTSWSEIATHRIEGFGDVSDEAQVTLDFADSSFVAHAASDANIETVDLVVTGTDGLPASLLLLDSDGHPEAKVDGVEFRFPTGLDAFDIVVAAAGTEDASVALGLYAQVGVFGTRSRIASGTVDFLSADTSKTVEMNISVDAFYDLDVGEHLRFELDYRVFIGSRAAATISFVDTNPLIASVSGILEYRHIISHGMGDNAGHLTVEQEVAGVITPIIDLTGTPTYEGVLKQSRVQEQQAQADFSESDTSEPGYVLNKDIIELDDTPNAFGNAGQVLQVNSGTNAMEWTDKTNTAAVSIVAYEASMVQRTSWHSTNWVNPILSVQTPT